MELIHPEPDPQFGPDIPEDPYWECVDDRDACMARFVADHPVVESTTVVMRKADLARLQAENQALREELRMRDRQDLLPRS